MLKTIIVAALFWSHTAWANTNHSNTNFVRSSLKTHYFLTLQAEREHSAYSYSVLEADTEASSSENWQQTYLKNEFGFELYKFIQFSGSLSSITGGNVDSDRGSAFLNGHGLSLGSALNFYAPFGNLKLGMGLLTSILTKTQEKHRSHFVSQGTYYELGYNYYFNPKLSIILNYQTSQSTLFRQSGSEFFPDKIESSGTKLGLGLTIWM